MLHILSHPSATYLRSNCLLVIRFITYGLLSHYWSQNFLVQFFSLPSTLHVTGLPEGYQKDEEEEEKRINHTLVSAVSQNSSRSSETCLTGVCNLLI